MTETNKSRAEREAKPSLKAKPRSVERALAIGLDACLERTFLTTEDDSLRERIGLVLDRKKVVCWPCEKYRRDPLLFAREILQIDLTLDQQRMVLSVNEYRRVAVASGRKVGKSTAACVLALWWYCTRARSRVVMTSVTTNQVDNILWSELVRLKRGASVAIVDNEGQVGISVFLRLADWSRTHGKIDLFPVKASQNATLDPITYDKQRDALWGNAERWIRSESRGGCGGAIPGDGKLMAELHAHEWVPTASGKTKVIQKKFIRTKLGRSPDRADAVCLAVWDDSSLEAQVARAIAKGSQSPLGMRSQSTSSLSKPSGARQSGSSSSSLAYVSHCNPFQSKARGRNQLR